MISPESLAPRDCWIEEIATLSFAPGAVDYASVIPFKEKLLQTAWNRFQRVRRGELRASV